MTPGSSVLRPKLTPSLMNEFTAWSSRLAELVYSLEVGHTYKKAGKEGGARLQAMTAAMKI